MKSIAWDNKKNNLLKLERNVSFEDIIICLRNNKILDLLDNPNQDKYAGQKMLIVEINNYAYLVPYVETEDEIFLKTIIPSRKATKLYLGERK